MYSALHECGHVSLWRKEAAAPARGEELTCARCGQATRVVELYGPWRVKCMDCNRIDHHATLRVTVVRRAVEHTRTWAHRVRVWQYGDTDSVLLVDPRIVGTQGELLSDAPF